MFSKIDLLAALDEVDQTTLALVESLTKEQLTVPFEPGINPPIWELGHAAFFYEFFILRALDDTTPAMPGYDEIWDSFEIKHRERWREGVVPDLQKTLAYYRNIIFAVRQRLLSKTLTPRCAYLYRYAISHQHMHVESLIWARQTLSYPPPPNLTLPPPSSLEIPALPGDARIPEGSYRIGLPHDDNFAGKHFGFDCEKPAFAHHLDAFKISKTLVTNHEFAQFVQAGQYDDSSAWSYGGKMWLRDNKARHPVSWKQSAGNWQERLFDQWHPLRPEAPVTHISFWEAEAFANWAGRRLPNEFEWEAAASGSIAKGDLDQKFFAQNPVTAFPESASSFGCLQMLGTAWEWTTSQFLPYDGFKIDMYPYMSSLQFGDHKVARGGSCATSSALVRITYRQAYHPDRRDVFTGFRTCSK